MLLQTNLKKLFSAEIFSALFKDSGMQALVVTNIVGNILRLVSSLILARMLSPEAFAITGLAATVVFAFNMISDGGFRAFILRHKEGDDDKVLNTLWSAKIIRNAVLAVLMFIFAESIANYFNIDDLFLVLQTLCLIFIADALLPIGYIAIERQNRVARVMYVRFASTVLSTIFMIVGVYLVRSYWPIVISMILNYVFQMVLGYFFIGYKGSAFAFNKKILVEFLGWAKYIIPSSIITLLLMQFDKVILGKSLSVNELGLYFVAFNFSSAAATFTIEYARGILLPYMSIVYRESPESYLEKYYTKKWKLSMLIAFGLGALSGGSYLLFDILYDDRYLSAGYYLSILLVVPMFALVTYSSEITLILYGQLKITLTANIIRLVWFFLGASVGYQWLGVPGLLITIALVEVFPAIYMMIRLKMLQAVSILKELTILIAAGIGFVSVRSFLTILGV